MAKKIVAGIVTLSIALIILAFPCGAVTADIQNYSDDIFLILDAVSRIDNTTAMTNSEEILYSCRLAKEDLIQAEENLTNQLKENPGNQEEIEGLITYAGFWILFQEAYSQMIMGSNAKQNAYEYLQSPSSDRFNDACEAFKVAGESYSSAKSLFEQNSRNISKIDSQTIKSLAPDLVIPQQSINQEIINRLTDNILIIQGYELLCQAELAKISAGNTVTSEVEDKLDAGKVIMKKLSDSPYMGEEAREFANITF